MFQNWYPTFRQVTFKSDIIPLPDSFVKYLSDDGVSLLRLHFILLFYLFQFHFSLFNLFQIINLFYLTYFVRFSFGSFLSFLSFLSFDY